MQLYAKQKVQLEKIAKKYHCNFFVLFGSQAQGMTHSKSDFDIAYSPMEDLDYSQEYRMSQDLCRVFKRGDIDMVNLRKAPPLLLYHAAFRSQLLAQHTPQSFDYFQMYAFKRYVEEAKPLLKMHEEYLKRNI